MSHVSLVIFAKTFGLIWLMGLFLIVVVWAYRPTARAAQERAARSILPDDRTGQLGDQP